MIWSRSSESLLWVVFVITSLLAETVSCNEARKNIPQNFDYAAYVEKYGKSYDNVETLSRVNLFYARTLGILKLNMNYISHKANYYLKQNQYTDMTKPEIEQSLVSKGIDLIPVVGSDLYPDAPADQVAQGEFGRDSINDGYSASSSSDSRTQKSPVNFLSDTENEKVEPRALIREIVEHSEDAKRLSRALELGNPRGRTLQTSTEANGIDHKPMVKPENKNYDPSLLPSKAWNDDVNRNSNYFVNFMMEDFAGNLEPYPMPEISQRKVLPESPSNKNGAGILSELYESVKMFYDYFSSEDDVVVVSPNAQELDKELDKELDSDSNKVNATKAEDKVEQKAQKGKLIFDIDWRRTGCISKPKSQSKCNACYAFATLDMMEFFYCRQKTVSTEFSAQYIIDCGRKSNLNGCQGGKLANVGTFIQKYGLQLNAAYPFDAQEHECPYDEKSDQQQKSWAFKPQISGWRMFPEIQAWYKWLPKSPIIVGINMPSDFLAYGGGVHDGSDCTTDMVHAMLLVGSGNEDGKPFWLLKNTFAEDWGEAGYFRLSKKAPIRCFNSAVVARAKFN